jgi:hypothetical protein
MIRHTLARLIFCGALVAGLASPALAGPPLVCFPFDIGTAASLPWDSSSGGFKGMRSDYDLDRLNRDTIALLTPSTPILVRMETLRRAALYASANQRTARTLLDQLLARAKASTSAGASLAEFDLGYLIETYRQLGPIAPFAGDIVKDLDGYGMVRRSLDARHGDPAIAFAAALITSGRGAYADHVRMARAGAGTDVLLAKNIEHVASRQ